MLAANHDILAEQDAEYNISFQYFDSSDSALDILSTYDNIRFVVRKSSLPQEKNLFEITYDGSVTEGYLPFPITEEYGTLSVVQNELTVTISTDTMTSVYPGSYFYYVFLETNVGQVDCLVKGKFVVEAP
jgi:hypothetical protein